MTFEPPREVGGGLVHLLCIQTARWTWSRHNRMWNRESTWVVLCRFESVAILVCGHVAIITETESTLHHNRVHTLQFDDVGDIIIIIIIIFHTTNRCIHRNMTTWNYILPLEGLTDQSMMNKTLFYLSSSAADKNICGWRALLGLQSTMSIYHTVLILPKLPFWCVWWA